MPRWLLAVPLAICSLTAAAGPVQLLDLRELPFDAIDGHAPRELSGLAWDANTHRLYAVSDGGRLFSFALDVQQGRLASLQPQSGMRLSRGAGRVNAEALWLRRGRDGQASEVELLVADEAAGEVLVLDRLGRIQSVEPLPDALGRRERWSSPSSGVEALAWHPRLGLLAAPQRPLKGGLAGQHTVYAGSGFSWSFAAHPGGKSTIKAIEILDGQRLLVLEKVKQGDGHLTVLRQLGLADCGQQRQCQAPAAVLNDARLRASDNFEGLACVDAEHCLLVSDSGPTASTGRTVLALVRLQWHDQAR